MIRIFGAIPLDRNDRTFSVESEVAREAHDHLRAKLTPPPYPHFLLGEEEQVIVANQQINPEAYDCLPRGLAFTLNRDPHPPTRLRAQKYLKRSGALGPGSSRCWARLSYVMRPATATRLFNQRGTPGRGAEAAKPRLTLQPISARHCMPRAIDTTPP